MTLLHHDKRYSGVIIGAIGLVAFGLGAAPALAQDAGTSGSSGAAGAVSNKGKSIDPGTNTGVGDTPMVGSGATGNGGVLQGKPGTPGSTGTSGPKATDPVLNN